MWELFLRQQWGPGRLIFAGMKIASHLFWPCPRMRPHQVIIVPQENLFCVVLCISAPLKILAIFKLCNGEDKVGDKTKKWGKTRAARGKKKQKTVKWNKSERVKGLEWKITHTTYTSVNHLSSINDLSVNNLSFTCWLRICLSCRKLEEEWYIWTEANQNRKNNLHIFFVKQGECAKKV